MTEVDEALVDRIRLPVHNPLRYKRKNFSRR